ncbi:MAG TPA: hypothetical protein VMV73_02570, partial [Candidatus Dormibacteraeota bacterium]|nr:hypothetical protein [Candidatus Dormibacteraeota bacterium]
AIEGKVDRLLGLKENVIIGKLIPAGTGMSRYRNLTIQPQGEDIDADGRPMAAQFDSAYAMTADEAALIEAMSPNGGETSRLATAYERNNAPATVHYEGEYAEHESVHVAKPRTQYDQRNGISVEEL